MRGWGYICLDYFVSFWLFSMGWRVVGERWLGGSESENESERRRKGFLVWWEFDFGWVWVAEEPMMKEVCMC